MPGFLAQKPDVGEGSRCRYPYTNFPIAECFGQGGHGVRGVLGNLPQCPGRCLPHFGNRVFNHVEKRWRCCLGTGTDLPQRLGCLVPHYRIVIRKRLDMSRDSLGCQGAYVKPLGNPLLLVFGQFIGRTTGVVLLVEKEAPQAQESKQDREADRLG